MATVTIRTSALSDTGDREETVTFWCADGGRHAYVYHITPDRPGTSGRQVCDGLYYRGNTLMATGDTLAQVVRRELRRRRDANRRELRRMR